MVFEKKIVEHLYNAVKEIELYFSQWDPKLYGTQVEILRRSTKKANNWVIIFKRNGELIEKRFAKGV
jgi:hypothetical protein